MNTVHSSPSNISVTQTGDGEHVLLIHCSSASGSEWTPLCAELGTRFRCVVPDQWSCGRSDPWPGNKPFSLLEEAAPIVEVMDQLEKPIHLIGHSYGGGVALKIARERPGMIRSLTLVEPSVFHLLDDKGPRERSLHREISSVAESVKTAVHDGNFWGGMARFVDYWNGDGAWDAMPVEARLKLSQRLPKVVLDFRALFEEPASIEDYAALSCPTLLVCGEQSPGPSRRIVEILRDSIPGAYVECIAGAGHMSPFTHPEVLNRAVSRHLNSVASDHRKAA